MTRRRELRNRDDTGMMFARTNRDSLKAAKKLRRYSPCDASEKPTAQSTHSQAAVGSALSVVMAKSEKEQMLTKLVSCASSRTRRYCG